MLQAQVEGRVSATIVRPGDTQTPNFQGFAPGSTVTLSLVGPAGAVATGDPVTADTARKLGLRVDIVAREYTTHGLVQAIVEAAARR